MLAMLIRFEPIGLAWLFPVLFDAKFRECPGCDGEKAWSCRNRSSDCSRSKIFSTSRIWFHPAWPNLLSPLSSEVRLSSVGLVSAPLGLCSGWFQVLSLPCHTQECSMLPWRSADTYAIISSSFWRSTLSPSCDFCSNRSKKKARYLPQKTLTGRASAKVELTSAHIKADLKSPRKHNSRVHLQICVQRNALAAETSRAFQLAQGWRGGECGCNDVGGFVMHRESSWVVSRAIRLQWSNAAARTSGALKTVRLCRWSINREFCRYTTGRIEQGSRYPVRVRRWLGKASKQWANCASQVFSVAGVRTGDLRTISMFDISRTTLRAERKGEHGCAELGDVHNRSNSGCVGFSSIAAGNFTLQSSSLMAAGFPSSSDSKL